MACSPFGLDPCRSHASDSRMFYLFNTATNASNPSSPTFNEVTMAKWDDLPAEIHIEILREAFCMDIIARHEACFETFASINDSSHYFYANAGDKRMASPVTAFPLSALLTCKYFYYLITSIKFNGLNFLETLQRYQMAMLEI